MAKVDNDGLGYLHGNTFEVNPLHGLGHSEPYAEITIHFDVIHVDSVYFEYTDCFTMISGCGRKSQTRLAFSLLFCCYHNYNVSNCYVIWWVKSFELESLVLLTRNSNKFAIYIIYVYCKLIYVLSGT